MCYYCVEQFSIKQLNHRVLIQFSVSPNKAISINNNVLSTYKFIMYTYNIYLNKQIVVKIYNRNVIKTQMTNCNLICYWSDLLM